MTPKQERFCQEYLIDLNATQAAIRSGYSRKTAEVQGSRLLSNAKIGLQIAAAQTKRAKRTEVTQDHVIAGLQREATLYGEGSSHGARVSAWTQLGKHLGMFTDKQTHDGEVTIRVVRGAKTQ